MAEDQFTAEMCEELFHAPKHTASAITWKAASGKVMRFRAQVLTDDGRGLDLTGYWRQVGAEIRWGFSLYYFGHCIRSYDMAKYHRNFPEPGRIRGPHKHRFSSSKIPRFAYKPDPPINESEPNHSLMDFLKEANIALKSEYHPFTHQSVLFP